MLLTSEVENVLAVSARLHAITSELINVCSSLHDLVLLSLSAVKTVDSSQFEVQYNRSRFLRATSSAAAVSGAKYLPHFLRSHILRQHRPGELGDVASLPVGCYHLHPLTPFSITVQKLIFILPSYRKKAALP